MKFRLGNLLECCTQLDNNFLQLFRTLAVLHSSSNKTKWFRTLIFRGSRFNSIQNCWDIVPHNPGLPEYCQTQLQSINLSLNSAMKSNSAVPFFDEYISLRVWLNSCTIFPTIGDLICEIMLVAEVICHPHPRGRYGG